MQTTLSNFTGQYNLGILENSQEHIRLNEIIAQKEPEYIKLFLGDIEYLDYEADNTTEKWTDFLNGKLLEIDTAHKINYTGFKKILTGLIYYEYIKATTPLMTNAGAVQKITENSVMFNNSYRISSIFNESIELWGWDWVCSFMEYAFYFDKGKYKNTAFNFVYWNNVLTNNELYPNFYFGKLHKINGFNL